MSRCSRVTVGVALHLGPPPTCSPRARLNTKLAQWCLKMSGWQQIFVCGSSARHQLSWIRKFYFLLLVPGRCNGFQPASFYVVFSFILRLARYFRGLPGEIVYKRSGMYLPCLPHVIAVHAANFFLLAAGDRSRTSIFLVALLVLI